MTAGDPGCPWHELRDTGLLWLFNRVVLHPRGFAMAIHLDDETGEATGWSLMGDGSEPWHMGHGEPEEGELFAKVQSLLAPRSRACG